MDTFIETWKIIHEIIGKQQSSTPSCIASDDTLITDETKLADIFNNYFSSIAANLADNTNTKDKIKSSFMPPPDKTSFYFYPITLFEIKRIISSSKSKTTSGPDDFPTKLFKFLPDSTLSVFAYIFNQSFVTSQYISAFKTARVILKLCLIIVQLVC